MKTVKFLFCDVLKTKLMQQFGVFEHFKVLIAPVVIAQVQLNFNLDDILRIRESSQSEPYRLIACLGENLRYVDPDVRVVSTGSHWAMLEDYLNAEPMQIPSLFVDMNVLSNEKMQ